MYGKVFKVCIQKLKAILYLKERTALSALVNPPCLEDWHGPQRTQSPPRWPSPETSGSAIQRGQHDSWGVGIKILLSTATLIRQLCRVKSKADFIFRRRGENLMLIVLNAKLFAREPELDRHWPGAPAQALCRDGTPVTHTRHHPERVYDPQFTRQETTAWRK